MCSVILLNVLTIGLASEMDQILPRQQAALTDIFFPR